ncbi:hypothetical protein KBD75_04860 [Candidatus Woesebacteria bacterium]|nr:hypothetical protein [Candidatus Woesebacteria bacterium]
MQNIYQAKGQTLIDQYRDTGSLFSKTIQDSVAKIGKSRSKLLKIRRLVAERTWDNLKDKSECREFVACFISWCDGAQITPEQGMWLMADNLSGCQTVVIRYASGVALLHSEEEFRDTNHIELHMTSPHTISFNENGETFKSLVYNNLFPGAGLYGWQRDMIVAVDSIFLKENEIEKVQNPLLANVIAWMVWRMKPSEADPEKIITLVNRLGTLIDGYVLNIVRKVDKVIEGYKLVLARDEAKVVNLGQENGDFLKQVNIIDPSEMTMHWALPPRNIWRGGNKYFINRIKILKDHAMKYHEICNMSLQSDILETTHLVIQKTIYGELSDFYVHEDLGAVCIGFVDHTTGTSVSCKRNERKPIQSLEYVDMIT